MEGQRQATNTRLSKYKKKMNFGCRARPSRVGMPSLNTEGNMKQKQKKSNGSIV